MLTTCDEEMWLPTARVHATPPAPPGPIGAGFDFGDAVIVVDAGHGGPVEHRGAEPGRPGREGEQPGHRRPAARPAGAAPRPSTGRPGPSTTASAVPAAGRVIMTRVGDGPAGDYEAGLTFRADVANTAAAHALVSIHTNAGWDRGHRNPGAATSSTNRRRDVTKDSRRLAKLMVEELRRGLAPFDADWVGTDAQGEVPAEPTNRRPVLRGPRRRRGAGGDRRRRVHRQPQRGGAPGHPRVPAGLCRRHLPGAGPLPHHRRPRRAPSHDPEVWYGSVFWGGPQPDCQVPQQGS